MSVELKPHAQLGFERPFTRQLTKTLAIHNPHARPVGFKIKTTAPRQYCVRPNAGRVEPGETVEVAVILQPMREDPPLDARCKDKFLVQSAIIPVEQEVKPLAELWSDLERTAKSSISEQKIRCTYLAANTTGTIPEGNGHDGDVTLGDASRMDESTYMQAQDTPSKAIRVNGSSSADASPAPISPASPTGDFHDSSAVEGLPTAGTASRPANPTRTSLAPIIQNASASTKPAAETAKSTAQSVQDELTAAKNEIARLTSELANGTVTGLRKRGNAAANSETVEQAKVAVQEVANTGVPVPVVAVIAFSVFLVTYLFF